MTEENEDERAAKRPISFSLVTIRIEIKPNTEREKNLKNDFKM